MIPDEPKEQMWADLCALWVPDDYEQPTPERRLYYQRKFDVAYTLQPKRILEIGVRAGYSAFAMLSACPEAEYVGWDTGGDYYGGVAGYFVREAPRILARFPHVHFELRDSQKVDRLDTTFDLAHIDGDHSYEGALHDLHLCGPACRALLVDDYEFIRSVQAATDHWLVLHTGRVRCRIVEDGGFRGNMLIDCSRLQAEGQLA